LKEGKDAREVITPETVNWFRNPVRVVSIPRKLSTTEEWPKGRNCSPRNEITETNVTDPIPVLGSSLREKVELKYNNSVPLLKSLLTAKRLQQADINKHVQHNKSALK
jgi:hypothetical protein